MQHDDFYEQDGLPPLSGKRSPLPKGKRTAWKALLRERLIDPFNEVVIENCFPFEKLQPLSSYQGRIKLLLLSIPKKRRHFSSIASIVLAFLRQMSQVRIILLLETIPEQPLEENPAYKILKEAGIPDHGNVFIHSIEIEKKSKIKFPFWVQDPFWVFETNEDKPGVKSDYQLLATSRMGYEHREGEEEISRYITEVGEHTDVHLLSLQFEGGNILVAEDFVLVGQDTINDNLDAPEDLADFQELFSKCFDNKAIIPVGCPEAPPPSTKEKVIDPCHEGTFVQYLIDKSDGKQLNHNLYGWRGECQPFFHLDLFLTLTGKNEQGAYQILVGQPCLGLNLGRNGAEEEIDRMANLQINDAEERIKKAIISLEEQLADQFDVAFIYIPLPLTYSINRRRDSIMWYWASYNNCLVETLPSGQTKLWLPPYGQIPTEQNEHIEKLKGWDELVKTQLTEAGFLVEFIETDFHFAAVRQGSLNCFTKCLQRIHQ